MRGEGPGQGQGPSHGPCPSHSHETARARTVALVNVVARRVAETVPDVASVSVTIDSTVSAALLAGDGEANVNLSEDTSSLALAALAAHEYEHLRASPYATAPRRAARERWNQVRPADCPANLWALCLNIAEDAAIDGARERCGREPREMLAARALHEMACLLRAWRGLDPRSRTMLVIAHGVIAGCEPATLRQAVSAFGADASDAAMFVPWSRCASIIAAARAALWVPSRGRRPTWRPAPLPPVSAVCAAATVIAAALLTPEPEPEPEAGATGDGDGSAAESDADAGGDTEGDADTRGDTEAGAGAAEAAEGDTGDEAEGDTEAEAGGDTGAAGAAEAEAAMERLRERAQEWKAAREEVGPQTVRLGSSTMDKADGEPERRYRISPLRVAALRRAPGR